MIAVLAAILFGSSVPAAEPLAVVDPRAVVERTRTTESTYALYAWNWVRDPDGSRRREWSAEFHSGTRHRVETPAVRIVADCAAHTGTALDVTSGESIEGPSVAAAACGISAHAPVRSLEWLGRRDSRFGPVDLLRLVDPENERTYAVSAEGILVAAEIFASDPQAAHCVQNEAVAVERTLPEGDFFSVESLARSVVADRYREPPEAAFADLWTRQLSCI